MNERSLQDVFVSLAGQDDNLGDSALRAAYYEAVQSPDRRIHILLENKTSDYNAGIAVRAADVVYTSRPRWEAASEAARRPVQLFEAGEINPGGSSYPAANRVAPLRHALDHGGALIVAGLGLRNPHSFDPDTLDDVLREAAVVSWRDPVSREAAGFGEVAPDWAFALGAPVAQWAPADQRPQIAVTLRFDRPWPGDAWIAAVRALARETGTRLVTVAQVARDAPRAVRLAQELGGEYLMAATMRHDDLDAHVREVYRHSLAVVSDRAHGLIIGATEGAYPVGSAADPEKLARIMAAAGLDALVGAYDEVSQAGARLGDEWPLLAPAITGARARVADLTERINQALERSA
ncbi:polysaccharide pyruvyl transferase family protein [Demequina sp.]|uniref:polysaccharide pyruvyl transferase family protein n=1 Tax=Demequina sp. TaxID=2050685 RepID=UPI003A848C26